MSISKFVGLDGMRGIAAIFIFIRHTGEYWGSFEFFHSYLAVDIFFILSGFVIAHAYENRFEEKSMATSKFIVIRLIRLYPMYFLGALLGIALIIIKSSHGIKTFGVEQDFLIPVVLFSLLFLPANVQSGQPLFPLNGASWSLFYELVVNCVYAVIRKFLGLGTLLIILIVTGSILAYCSYKVGNLDIGVMGGSKSIFAATIRAHFGIFFGLFLHKIYLKGYRTPKILDMQLLPILIMSAIFTVPHLGIYNWLFDIITVAFILPYCILWIATTESNQRLIKPYLFVGMISYPLYILHGPLKEFGDLFFRDVIVAAQPLSGIAFLVAILAGCWIVVRYLDEPIRARLNRIFVKKT